MYTPMNAHIKSSLVLATIFTLAQNVAAQDLQNALFEITENAREDALNAQADNFAAGLWDQAEEIFNAASQYLESGDATQARTQAETAEALFRDAELTAIKAQYLSNTLSLLGQAAQARVPRYAPKTYERAQMLLSQAEQAINENRYEMELPINLIEQANYEVRHAVYLAERISALRDDDLTEEDMILDHESQITEIAAATNRTVQLDTGTEPIMLGVITDIEDAHQRELQLKLDLEESRRQIISLEEEIRELDEQLSDLSEEHVVLVQRLEAEERIRSRFTRMETMFSSEEVQVSREGNSIILRLVGLTFEVGQSDINPTSGHLLRRVYNAVEIFPRSQIIVEGHTDSYGGSQSNLTLSRSRAEAIGNHLNTVLGLAEFRVSAVGYGQTRPIANNETSQGRARNRRIEIRIEPQAE